MAKNTKYDFLFYSINGGLKHTETMTEQEAHNFAAAKGYLGRYTKAKADHIKAKSTPQKTRQPRTKTKNTPKKGGARKK